MHGMADEMKKKAAMEALHQLVSDMMGLEGKEEEPGSSLSMEDAPGDEKADKAVAAPLMGKVKEEDDSDMEDMEGDKKSFMNGGKKKPMTGKAMMVMMKMSKASPMKKGKKA